MWYKFGAADSIIILKFEAAIGGAIFIRCPALGALGARLRSGGGLDLEAFFGLVWCRCALRQFSGSYAMYEMWKGLYGK